MSQVNIDPTIRLQMDQNFAKFNTQLDAVGIRSQDSAAFVKAQSETQFLNESRLVGAVAAQNLNKDGLSSQILQSRSAAGQPQSP